MTDQIKKNNKIFFRGILWISFLSLLGLLIYGFLSNPQIIHKIWPQREVSKLLIFSGVYFLFVSIVYYFRSFHLIYYGLITFFILLVNGLGIASIVSVIYFLSSAFLLGDWILHKQENSLEHSSLDNLFALLLGVSIYMTLMGYLVHFKVNTSLTYWTLLAIPFCFRLHKINFFFQKIHSLLHYPFWEKKREYFSFSFLVLLLFIHLVHVFRPEVSFDALSSHLSIPAYIANYGFWHFDFNISIWALMPMGGDWIYTILYVLGEEFAVKLINYAFFVIFISLLYLVFREIVSREISLLLVTLFASTPFLQLETSCLFVENIWSVFLLAGFFGFYKFRESGQKKYFFLMVVFGGITLSCKVTSIFLLAPVGIFFFYEWIQHKEKRPSFPHVCYGILIVLIVGFYPYIYSYYLTQNPVFPFMNGVFKSPYTSPISFSNPIWKQPISIWSLYDMTFHSHKYLEAQDGAFGFHYLVLFPFSLLFFRKKTPYLAWYSLLSGVFFFVLVFHFQSYLRYLYPSLALFMILVAFSLKELQEIDKILYRCLLGFCLVVICINVYFMPTSGWWHREFPVQLLVNQSSNKEYVAFHAPEKKIISYLNLKYGKKIRIGLFTKPYTAKLQSYSVTNSWYSEDFSKKIQQAKSKMDIFSTIKQYGLSHFVVPLPNSPTKLPSPLVAFFKKYTKSEFVYQSIYVASLKTEYEFTTEFLKNYDFKRGLLGWNQNGKVKYIEKQKLVQVNNTSTLVQSIKVKDQYRYFYSITAKSSWKKAYVRIQVNWHNQKGKFLGTTIIPKLCTSKFQRFSAKMKPLVGSVMGMIYVGGHGEKMIEVREVSFRGP